MSYSKEFNDAMDLCMLSEVGPWFRRTHPACASGSVVSKSDRVAVGYVNDPADRGGETKFGIAKNANPELNITTLNYTQAEGVYYKKYWDSAECDKLPMLLNIIHFDATVNHGAGNSGKFLQRALGQLGKMVDGEIGPKTLTMIAAKTKTLAEIKVLCLLTLDQRDRFFKAIVANNPSQLKFINGWLSRTARLRKYIQDYKG